MADQQVKQSSCSSSIAVVMVPFPLQSHLNQLLQLSHVIASYDIKVHYVASSLHISRVKSRATNSNTNTETNPNVVFHDLPNPGLPPNIPANSAASFEASMGLRGPVRSLLESLSEGTTRLVVVLDPLMSVVVQDARALGNVEFYVYNCIAAVATFAFARDAAGLKMREEIPSAEGGIDDETQAFVARQFECLKTIEISGHLRNTCRVLESEFIDLVEESDKEADDKIKHWAIGPLENLIVSKTRQPNMAIVHGERIGKCLEWLNEQEPKSVLYVSFGTTSFMEEDQIRELAIGLEESGTRFIWVLRDADKVNVSDEIEARRPKLPLGFEERAEQEGLGMIVREWVPQLEILGHPSTGGFMSHCGWNSCLESLSRGVPVLAWPIAGDQCMNAALATTVLKVGISARDWAKKDELVSSSVIAEAVKRLMNSEKGSEIRERAENLGLELRKCTKKDGISHLELDSFVAHITRV